MWPWRPAMKGVPGLAGHVPLGRRGTGPMADPIQASAPDAPGSTGGAVGPAAGEEAHRAPGLMVPSKEGRGLGGEATRAEIRITEADLGPSGGAVGVFATRSAPSEPGPTGAASRGRRCSGAGLVDVGRTGAALAAVPGDTALRGYRKARSSGALGK